MVQFLSNFFSWISSIFVGFFKSSHFFLCHSVRGCMSLAWKDYSRLLSIVTNFWLICISLFDRFVLNEPFIDNTGPSLGSLTVYTKNAKSVMTPVWRLYNHQGPEWRYAQAPIPETTEPMVRFLIHPALTKGQASINK